MQLYKTSKNVKVLNISISDKKFCFISLVIDHVLPDWYVNQGFFWPPLKMIKLMLYAIYVLE